MTYSLNTKSGYLHQDDHGGSENVEEFERADQADLAAKEAGVKLLFCTTCFGENRNTLAIKRAKELEEKVLAGKSELGESLSGTTRVGPPETEGSVHSDAAVPAGRPAQPTR